MAEMSLCLEKSRTIKQKAHEVQDIIKVEQWVKENKHNIKNFVAIRPKLLPVQKREEVGNTYENTDCSVSE